MPNNKGKAVLVPFHRYTPFGEEFYRPIFDFFIKNYRTIWGKEVDKLYILDSTWGIKDDPLPDSFVPGMVHIKVDPALRYYDVYKSVLKSGLIEEDLIMFMDNDTVVYKRQPVEDAFAFLQEGYDVASIYDTIGSMKVDLPDGKNKFCPYWFATKRKLLLQYLKVDWSPDAMPYTETFGLLTEAMLKDNLKPIEFEEDKTAIHIDNTRTDEKGKNLGYYHIRAGSTPAYLLATKMYGNKDTYWKYINEQPKNEYLRQAAWYQYMGGNPEIIVSDAGVGAGDWEAYMKKFLLFHGL